MKKSYTPELYIALMHYPVLNRSGEAIASAVTSIDLHDISRAAKTYGVSAFYVVTPLKDQKELVDRIVSHWDKGAGAEYNPDRKRALSLVKVMESLEAVQAHIGRNGRGPAKTVVTSARESAEGGPHGAERRAQSTEHKAKSAERISHEALRERLKEEKPHLLLFGTAWGFSDDFISRADYVLEPVKGRTDYNHLSVRSAASIILDRLMGKFY